MLRGKPFDDIRDLITSMPQSDDDAKQRTLAILEAFPGPAAPLGDLASNLGWLSSWQSGDPTITRPLVAVFAGTHKAAEGVFEDDIISIAKRRVKSVSEGSAGVRGIAGGLNAAFKVYEMGLDYPCGDITKEASLSERDCAAAIAFGMEVVAEGADIIALGNVGVGAAIAAATIAQGLYGGSIEYWAGGEGDIAVRRATQAAIASQLHRGSDPLEILGLFGGRDIAGMVGAILAARHQAIPVVLDGFIACIAAAVLHSLDATAIDHCMAGHLSSEPAHEALLDRMGLSPLQSYGIGVGDGTGAAFAIAILQSACRAYSTLKLA